MKSLIESHINIFLKIEEKLGKYCPILYTAVSSLFFSIMSLCVKLARTVPAYEIIYLRALLNVLFCFIIINYQKYYLISKDRETNRLLIIRGYLGGIALSLMFHSIYLLPLSYVSVLQRITPLWVGIFGTLIYKEPYKLVHIITTFISFLGIILIFKPTFIFGEDQSKHMDTDKKNEYYLGLILITANTIVASFIQLTIRALRHKTNILIVVFYFNFFNLVISGIGQFFEYPKVLDLYECFLIFMIGLLGFIAQLLRARGLFLEKAFILSIISYLSVIFGYIFDIFIFNETIDIFAYFGIAVIMLSMGGLIYSGGKE